MSLRPQKRGFVRFKTILSLVKNDRVFRPVLSRAVPYCAAAGWFPPRVHETCFAVCP